MLDIRWIRENSDKLDHALLRRGSTPQAKAVLEIDRQWRESQTQLQLIQSERNKASKKIADAKSSGVDVQQLVKHVSELKKDMQILETLERNLSQDLKSQILNLPNIPHQSIPDGSGEENNIEIRKFGLPGNFSFTIKDHVELGVAFGLMDFESASLISGARFVSLKGDLALLQRALSSYMLTLHTEQHGYIEYSVPYLVRDAALVGTGQLPKFSEDLFCTTSGLWLIPTAEVSLTNLIREQIIDGSSLPLRMTAHTPCFRSEAGAAGKDTHGMIRQHQFDKVELVSIVTPDDAESELERMTVCAESVLRGLELPYRVVELCAGDIGFSAVRTFDIEVWLPSQNCYREISSCSNCGDFQSRRMNARYRSSGDTKGTNFPHTLNGSGLAVGRTLVAVLENYQNQNGSVTIPEILRPLMGDKKIIELHD